MPLVAFSKILSSKSPRDLQFDQVSTSSAHPSPSFHSRSGSTTPTSSKKSPDFNQGSSSSPSKRKDRFSRAFTFNLDPFNVIASLRGRSKLRSVYAEPPANTNSTSVCAQSQTVFSGYEDAEYGEPEADAEEIRRPSGLGRRASVADYSEKGEYEVTAVGQMDPTQCHAQEDARSVSQRSVVSWNDSASSVEIRYPSGLGNIKLSINTGKDGRPLSTYPYFDVSGLSSDIFDDDLQKSNTLQQPNPFHRGSSSYLSAILPILESYIPRQTLLSLTLADRAVGTEARKILWRSVRMCVTIHAAQRRMSVDGTSNLQLLEILSAREVARLVNSLELTCRLVYPSHRSTPQSYPRLRPPPLTLVPNNHGAPLRPASVKLTPSRPSLPLSVSPEASYDHGLSVDATEPFQEDKAPLKKKHRASLLLQRSSMSLRTSAVKIRPASLRLSGSLGLLRQRASETLGKSTSDSAACSPASQNITETCIFPLQPPPQEAVWTPPAEWGRVPMSDQPRSASPSSSSAKIGWVAPVAWEAKPSSPLITNPSRHKPSLSSLLVQLPVPPSPVISVHPPELDAITPTPSSHVHRSPFPSHRNPSEENPSTPVIPSPVTPYSAISLSAFPLPPASPPSVPRVPHLPAEYSYLYLPDLGDDPLLTPTMRPAPPQSPEPVTTTKTLAMVLKDMANLKGVTLKYVLSEPSNHCGPVQSFNKNIPTKERADLNLVKQANETLAAVLPDLELTALKVICPADAQNEPCRQQWLELTHSRKYLKLDVTCTQDGQALTSTP
ncbi:hypothetical protein K439DRAFT_1639670 [Ramaria rubella]|nr:hypothetical protein K439DRAFT_1639670 [Ramaria rubella]